MAQNHEQLEALLTEAEQLIARFDAGDRFDHLRPADDIIRDLMANNAFNEGARIEGSRELQVLSRLQEIRYPDGHEYAPHQPVNLYSRIETVGYRTLPRGSSNTISTNVIQQNNTMVNFQGESAHGRYYKRSTFNSLATNSQGRKKNPYTRVYIAPGNVKAYTAKIAEKGGKRRKKTRKTKLTRSRK